MTAPKIINCPGINVMKDVQDTESDKHYWEHERWFKYIDRWIMFMERKTRYLEDVSSVQIGM